MFNQNQNLFVRPNLMTSVDQRFAPWSLHEVVPGSVPMVKTDFGNELYQFSKWVIFWVLRVVPL